MAGDGARRRRPGAGAAAGAVAGRAPTRRCGTTSSARWPSRRTTPWRVRLYDGHARRAADGPARPRHPGRAGGGRGAGACARAGRPAAVGGQRSSATSAPSCSTSRPRASRPADLRAELRLRAALVGGAGLIAGLVVGVVLSPAGRRPGAGRRRRRSAAAAAGAAGRMGAAAGRACCCSRLLACVGVGVLTRVRVLARAAATAERGGAVNAVLMRDVFRIHRTPRATRRRCRA